MPLTPLEFPLESVPQLRSRRTWLPESTPIVADGPRLRTRTEDRGDEEALLSVVVPVYNEVENLKPLIEEIEAGIAPLQLPRSAWELILVDDGSTDSSAEVLSEIAARRPNLRVLRLRKNSGQSSALAVGYKAARGRWTATLDGDLQNDPADLPGLLSEAIEGRWDVVSGIRTRRRDSWIRKISSKLANAFRRKVLRDGTTDVGCSLRVCRTELLRNVPAFNGMHRFLPALLLMQGARLHERPVNHRPRLHGTSKYGISNRLWRGLLDLAGVRWLQLRTVSLDAVEVFSAGACLEVGDEH